MSSPRNAAAKNGAPKPRAPKSQPTSRRAAAKNKPKKDALNVPVVATELGFYNGRRIRPGTEFIYPLAAGEKLPRWMQMARSSAPAAEEEQEGGSDAEGQGDGEGEGEGGGEEQTGNSQEGSSETPSSDLSF